MCFLWTLKELINLGLNESAAATRSVSLDGKLTFSVLHSPSHSTLCLPDLNYSRFVTGQVGTWVWEWVLLEGGWFVQVCVQVIRMIAEWRFNILFYLFIFLLLFNRVFSIFTPPCLLPHPSPPSTLEPTPFDFVHGSFIHVPWWPFPYFPPLSLFPPLWLLSVCSLFQCLWLYFAYLIVLLIRFHL